MKTSPKRSCSVIENERFGLVFAKTGSIILGTDLYTAKERPVRIQYKCLVPIYVFSEMELLFPKQNYNILSHSLFTRISVRDLYISMISLPILLQGNMWSRGPILGIYKLLTDT